MSLRLPPSQEQAPSDDDIRRERCRILGHWADELARDAGQPPYDAADDLSKSIEWSYDHIRARKAAGGKGWRED